MVDGLLLPLLGFAAAALLVWRGVRWWLRLQSRKERERTQLQAEEASAAAPGAPDVQRRSGRGPGGGV